MPDKRVFRVCAHNVKPVDYPISSPQYYVAESAEKLRDELYDIHYSMDIIIDEVVPVTVEEVVNLLNLYIE